VTTGPNVFAEGPRDFERDPYGPVATGEDEGVVATLRAAQRFRSRLTRLVRSLTAMLLFG